MLENSAGFYTNGYSKDAKILKSLELEFPDGGKSSAFLGKFLDSKIFGIGLHSKLHWNAVVRILNVRVVKVNMYRATLDSKLPLEIHLETLQEMDLRSLSAMVSTCAVMHAEANRLIEAHMLRCFRTMDLDWYSLRFMMALTDSMVSGLWALRMLFPNREIPTEPTQMLEIFVKSLAEHTVLRYFAVATDWERVPGETPHSISDAVEKTISLVHKDLHRFPENILVHICRNDPIFAIYRQPLTVMMIVMSDSGVHVPYADLTFNDESIVNHEFIDLTSELGKHGDFDITLPFDFRRKLRKGLNLSGRC
ncbi:hypothetical protein B0H11DRAFT_1898691 [Mycena galericulata]|nr:hypothetical protein B0H11DRAFT_1898691 [Mycena galericulata]